jgi:hypothetical protein
MGKEIHNEKFQFKGIQVIFQSGNLDINGVCLIVAPLRSPLFLANGGANDILQRVA